LAQAILAQIVIVIVVIAFLNIARSSSSHVDQIACPAASPGS